MKKVLVFLLLINTWWVNAQIHEPVKWSTSVEKIKDGEYYLVINATIDKGWHLYSQTMPEDAPNGTPLPTSFKFEENGNYKLSGGVIEPKGHTAMDPVFEANIKYFDVSATFKQKIKTSGSKSTVKGIVEFMVCDDARCLPPTEVELSFEIPEEVKKAVDEVKEKKKKVSEEKEELVKESVEDDVVEIDSAPTEPVQAENTIEETVEKEEPATTPMGKRGLWGIFIISFLSGFAALLTPCVFPMIPLTVSFFTKQSKNKTIGIRNGIFYGLSIVLIYVILGTAVTAIFGADSLNALATNIWFNLIFFLLLVVFAVSFLGAFEITLPSSWGTKIDSRADKGGLIGIFFMALALAIVSFSCTGPIVGTLLVEAASKGGTAPIIGMLGFSLAIAIPFALFAAFPGWMNSLPKSGGWLNTVKVVLGFLELALAFKFLSQADLVLQLHWLEREVFIAIWIAIFGALSVYLFGKLQLPHDSPVTKISVGRLSLGLLTLSFTIYMIPGLWGAPLNLISAFPPPQDYSESPYGVGYTKTGGGAGNIAHADLPDGAHLLAPHDILAFNDYDKGLEYAKKIGKPVLIDFTGWACVNCRKMEQNVWPDEKVMKVLKGDVVLISLYVDDKRPLPEDEVIESVLKPGKKLKYIGQKWTELQQTRYQANAQPFYVLLNHQEEKLIEPAAYTPNPDEFHMWLEKGIGNFTSSSVD